jgi:hypothetical protein
VKKMASKATFKPTPGHHTSLSDIVDQSTTVVVFGKIVGDLQPTSQGHRFAQIFGYKRNGVCSKLPNPVVVALPDPDGPADDCGWDPGQFVRWQVPSSFATTQLHLQPATLTRALSSFAPAATASIGLTSDQRVEAVVMNWGNLTTPPINTDLLQQLAPSGVPFQPDAVQNLRQLLQAEFTTITLKNSDFDPGSIKTLVDLKTAISGMLG